ncbi:MAG TPA: hypothetical protein ENK18_20190 [Deltaproteobacteria bacterium]|nr:hypothetical protein [Deltaproteobacteria bacterium]
MQPASLVAFIQLSDDALSHDMVLEHILGVPGALAGLRPGDGRARIDPALQLEETRGVCSGDGWRAQRLELWLTRGRISRIDYWLQDLSGLEALFERVRHHIEAHHGPPGGAALRWRLQAGELALDIDQSDVFGSDRLHLALAAPGP